MGPPGVQGLKNKIKSADPDTRTLNRMRFTDHRPPPFLAPLHTRAFDQRCCTSQVGAFAKDGAPNKVQRKRAFGGCGRWRLIPDTVEDRTTWVEGIGQGQKRGWSVVCEPCTIQSMSGWVSMFFFF